ncbi:hypothetical protein [Nocardioides sp.]|uniref:hypothetical protein n=1 Tax=Nocardioides sp. TaxID=35761 RepID=UPI003518141F
MSDTRADAAPVEEARRVHEPDPTAELFASRSVAEHLVRGVLGVVLAVAAFALAGRSSGLSLLLLAPAALLWRGCPTCWALGLVQTRARCASGCEVRKAR